MLLKGNPGGDEPGRVIYFHCFSGLSGDMALGALLDTGRVSLEELEAELARVPLAGYSLQVSRVKRKGISGTRVQVRDDKKEARELESLASLQEIVTDSSLDGRIKQGAAGILTRLAEAEARIHGVSPEEVHFHEIGGVDTLVDILGTLILLDLLGVEKVVSSPLHLGTGFTDSAHGILPLPAPASLELLRGIPVYSRGVKGELVTPTGAALISSLASSFGPLPEGIISVTGWGAGSRDLEEQPNLLRVVILEGIPKNVGEPGEGLGREKLLLVETNIDDMNPEFLPRVMEGLLEAGAWDVYFTPVHMKKNRPGVKLSLLCKPGLLGRLGEILLRETSSLGFRVLPGEKFFLDRRAISLDTPLGKVRVKAGYRGGKVVKYAPEYEDCLRISRQQGTPLQEVYRQAEECFRKKHGGIDREPGRKSPGEKGGQGKPGKPGKSG